MAKKKHNGTLLAEAIKKQGLKKNYVAEKLGYSRVWLDEMIKTGNFTPEKLKLVKKIINK